MVLVLTNHVLYWLKRVNHVQIIAMYKINPGNTLWPPAPQQVTSIILNSLTRPNRANISSDKSLALTKLILVVVIQMCPLPSLELTLVIL